MWNYWLANQGDCNFDDSGWESVCGWQQLTDDDKDWQRASQSSNSHKGPTSDHTLGSLGLSCNIIFLFPFVLAVLSHCLHLLCAIRSLLAQCFLFFCSFIQVCVSGYYIYISNGAEPVGRTAAITTGVQYPPSSGICYVRFWYHMYNDDTSANIGALRLYLDGDLCPLLYCKLLRLHSMTSLQSYLD